MCDTFEFYKKVNGRLLQKKNKNKKFNLKKTRLSIFSLLQSIR